MLRHVH